MAKFSKRALANLATCDPALEAIAKEAITYFDFAVTCGHRGQSEQDQAYAEGKSKTKWPNGKHNKTPSLAMDLVPWENGAQWDSQTLWSTLAMVIKSAAKALDIEIFWGGDWKTFVDKPHFELAKPSGWTRDKDGNPVRPQIKEQYNEREEEGRRLQGRQVDSGIKQQTSELGIQLIKSFEGQLLTAYNDCVGVPTIGFGHTKGVTNADVDAHKTITITEADALLRQDLEEFEKAVRDLVKVPLSRGQFDSLVSFSFNLGAAALAKSTLLRLLNAGDYDGAANEFPKWCHAGGIVRQGLARRRAAEKRMFEEK